MLENEWKFAAMVLDRVKTSFLFLNSLLKRQIKKNVKLFRLIGKFTFKMKKLNNFIKVKKQNKKFEETCGLGGV